MGFWIFMLCCNLLMPALMTVFGWVFLHRPPREINGMYGYRTSRSMASKEAWNFAHEYMGKLWFRLGLALFPLTVLAMLPCLGRGEGAVGIWGGSLCLVECALMMLPIIPTEKALKRTFG